MANYGPYHHTGRSGYSLRNSLHLNVLSQNKAIIFDLGGVVLNLDYERTVTAFKQLGGDQFERLHKQSHQEKIFDQYETGNISSAEFRRYLKQFLPAEISDEALDDAWNAMLLDLPSERIQLLKTINKTHRIFLLSNTNEIHLSKFRTIISDRYEDPFLLERIFERTYYSHLLGKRKPDKETFEYVLRQNYLDAESTLFVDDSAQHIEGAKSVGLNTHHLTSGSIVDIFL